MHILRIIFIRINKILDKKNTYENNIYIYGIKFDYQTEFIMQLKDLFESDYYNYCSFCENKIDGFEKINVCGNKTCVCYYYDSPTDKKITKLFETSRDVLIFLLKVTIAGTKHLKADKIYNPLPFIKDINDVESFRKLIPYDLSNNNMEKIIKILEKYDDEFELWKNMKNDNEYKHIYCILKNCVSNNYFSMSNSNIFEDKNLITLNINGITSRN